MKACSIPENVQTLPLQRILIVEQSLRTWHLEWIILSHSGILAGELRYTLLSVMFSMFSPTLDAGGIPVADRT
jgi:hypothetical protein